MDVQYPLHRTLTPMPHYPSPGHCPVCNWFEYRPVLVKTSHGFRETELLQCAGCSIVFRSALQFSKARELLLTADASALLAELTREPAKSDGEQHRTWWIDSRERPVSGHDIGRFVIGTGYSGWIGGIVGELGGGLCITSSERQPIAANSMHFYVLLDPPPTLKRPK